MINKGTLIAGILVGTAAAILFAPEKGSKTRSKLKKEAKDIKDQLTKDFTEVKDDISKAANSGKETFKQGVEDIASKTSYKTERVITFLENQLAILKQKNKAFQKEA